MEDKEWQEGDSEAHSKPTEAEAEDSTIEELSKEVDVLLQDSEKETIEKVNKDTKKESLEKGVGSMQEYDKLDKKEKENYGI